MQGARSGSSSPRWPRSILTRLDHAKSSVVAAVDHLDLVGGRISEQVKIVVDEFQLVQRFLQFHRGHRKVFAPHTGCRKGRLLAVGEGLSRRWGREGNNLRRK